MWNFRQGTVAKSTATDSHLQLQLQGPLLASLGVACTWYTYMYMGQTKIHIKFKENKTICSMPCYECLI